jgi:hypothetical protein
MADAASMSIAVNFRQLPAPCVRRTRRHALADTLVITLCAAVYGADDGVSIARFVRAKRKWFPDFRTVRHGIPGDVPASDGRGQDRTRRQEPLSLVAREHARPERAPDDAKDARPRDLGPGILQGEEPADLADQSQPMRTGRVGFVPAPRHELPDDVRRGHGVIRGHTGGQEAVQRRQALSLGAIAIPSGPLTRDEALQDVGKW